jgi:hypothetical protein
MDEARAVNAEGTDRSAEPAPGRRRRSAPIESATKIRAIRGPPSRPSHQRYPLSQVDGVSDVYHQQTKNVLCSYSPKKLGFV